MRLSEHETLTGRHYVILGMAWAGWLFDFYDLILYSFLYSFIGADLGLTKADHALVMGASLGATALGGLVFGFLADRFGRRAVLQWTILVYSGGALLCGFANTLPQLLAFRALTGLGVGGEWAAGHTLIAETFPPAKRGRFGALMQTGAPLGVGLAALVGSFVAPAIGWRATFILSATPAILVTMIRRHMPESDLWLASRARAPWTPLEDLREVLFGSLAWTSFRAFVLTACNMSSYWFTSIWLPAYLREERGMSVAKSGLWILVIVSGELVGYATFGFVSDRFGRKRSYALYAGVMSIGLVMITVAWNLIAGQPFLILIFMAVVGIGTGTWSNFGPYYSELFPTHLRNTGVGAVFNAARGIQFVTPIVIERVSHAWGLAGGISLAAAFSAAGAIWVFTLPETRGRVLTVTERGSAGSLDSP
ncbi:MAG: MFS transporter [Acidobacteria bacterium]|nr:MFS transporter [Acidobacteriota bacterium]